MNEDTPESLHDLGNRIAAQRDARERASLRDRLAMYAMPIAMEATKDAGHVASAVTDWKTRSTGVARRAYQLADAMLAARDETDV